MGLGIWDGYMDWFISDGVKVGMGYLGILINIQYLSPGKTGMYTVTFTDRVAVRTKKAQAIPLCKAEIWPLSQAPCVTSSFRLISCLLSNSEFSLNFREAF